MSDVELDLRLEGDWERAFAFLAKTPRRLEMALHQAILQEAHRLRDEMVRGIDSGAPGGRKFTPHAPNTLTIRKFRGGKGSKGSKILIASAGLRNSIMIVPIRRGVAFVGVRRSSGKGVNLAKLHEYGKTFTIPFTPRMRRFLFAALGRGGRRARTPRAKGGMAMGKTTITIRIPPRPFIGPVVGKALRERSEIRARISRVIAEVLRP